MKLELHHITPYADKAVFGTFNGVRDILTDIDFVNGIVSSLNNGSVELKNFKLELISLSDLTKEIDKDEDVTFLDWIESEYEIDVLAFIDAYGIEKLPYEVMEYLFEWHFDIFNLIENNLAIDINTIKL